MGTELQSVARKPLDPTGKYMHTVLKPLVESRNSRGLYEYKNPEDGTTRKMVNIPLEMEKAKYGIGNFDVPLDNLSLSESGRSFHVKLDRAVYNVYWVDKDDRKHRDLMKADDMIQMHEKAIKNYVGKARQMPKVADQVAEQVVSDKPLPAVAEKMPETQVAEKPEVVSESEQFIDDSFFDM